MRVQERTAPAKLAPLHAVDKHAATERAPSSSSDHSAEADHAKLADESGLPLTHPAFKKWRLQQAVGHGAFSKVIPAV